MAASALVLVHCSLSWQLTCCLTLSNCSVSSESGCMVPALRTSRSTWTQHPEITRMPSGTLQQLRCAPCGPVQHEAVAASPDQMLHPHLHSMEAVSVDVKHEESVCLANTCLKSHQLWRLLPVHQMTAGMRPALHSLDGQELARTAALMRRL